MIGHEECDAKLVQRVGLLGPQLEDLPEGALGGHRVTGSPRDEPGTEVRFPELGLGRDDRGELVPGGGELAVRAADRDPAGGLQALLERGHAQPEEQPAGVRRGLPGPLGVEKGQQLGRRSGMVAGRHEHARQIEVRDRRRAGRERLAVTVPGALQIAGLVQPYRVPEGELPGGGRVPGAPEDRTRRGGVAGLAVPFRQARVQRSVLRTGADGPLGRADRFRQIARGRGDRAQLGLGVRVDRAPRSDAAQPRRRDPRRGLVAVEEREP